MLRTEGQRALACRCRNRDRNGSGDEPLISRPVGLFANAEWEDAVSVHNILTIATLTLLLDEGGGIATLQLERYIVKIATKQEQLSLGWID